ncbi:MAG: ECF transporter S component [Christensenellales bacterium]
MCNFLNLPAILGGFAMGPIGGAIIVVIRTLIKLPFSSTAYVGEFGDLLIGLATVLTSSLIYKYCKTKKGGILGLVFGSLAWVVVAMIVNATILIPFYSKAFGFSAVVEMCRSIFPKITETNFMVFYILGSILPFNLMLSFIVSIVTFLVYKRISALFKKDFIH